MRIGPQRPVNPEAIVAPPGYRVEALVTGLAFPSAISFGPGGELYLAEAGGVAGRVVAMPRVLRIDPDRSVTEIGRLDHPIVGLVYRQGELFIAEDGPSPRILRVTAEGEVKVLLEGLPGGGDYGLSGLTLDASGALLFGLGTRTNSGVVGLDNLARGWALAHPEWSDVPGADVELAGVNYVTSQPGAMQGRTTTGGLKAFGHRSEAGESARGENRCGGAVYRLALDAPGPERLAWGLRNPIGLCAGADGKLYATEGGMEERGSRPIAGASDNLWEIRPGGYYGWPDHAGGIPVTEARFRLPGHPLPRRLLSESPPHAGQPLAAFPARSGVGRADMSVSPDFGFAGELFVALSGPWSAPAYPAEAGAGLGHRVVRVDPRTGATVDFLVNRSGEPSSSGSSGGLERPFDVAFDPTGDVLYVIDLGDVQVSPEDGIEPFGGTGVVWRVSRLRPSMVLPAATDEPAETADAGGDGETDEQDDEAASVDSLTWDEPGAPEEESFPEPAPQSVEEAPEAAPAASSQESPGDEPEAVTSEAGEAEPGPEEGGEPTTAASEPEPVSASDAGSAVGDEGAATHPSAAEDTAPQGHPAPSGDAPITAGKPSTTEAGGGEQAGDPAADSSGDTGLPVDVHADVERAGE